MQQLSTSVKIESVEYLLMTAEAHWRNGEDIRVFLLCLNSQCSVRVRNCSGLRVSLCKAFGSVVVTSQERMSERAGEQKVVP